MIINHFIDEYGNRFWTKGLKTINSFLISQIEEIYYFDDRLLHRQNGPAIIYHNNTYDQYQFFYDGQDMKCSSNEEYEKLIKLRLLW